MRLFLRIAALGGLLVPAIAHAFPVDSGSVSVLCGIIPCNGAVGGGAAGLSMYVFDRVVTALEIGILAAVIITFFMTAVQMVAFSANESTTSESRQAFIHMITGLAIVGFARWFVIAFSPVETGSALVNPGMVESGFANVVTYFRLIISITLTVNCTLQAFRLITSQGAQDSVDKAKNRLIAGFIGAGLIMMANVIVVAVQPGWGGSSMLAIEIAGIANYLIMILGFLALLSMVLAGVLLIVSIDEGLKEKAKTLIKTSIVGLITVMVSYALVTGFIAM